METENLVDTGITTENNGKKRTLGMRFSAFFLRNWSWLIAAAAALMFMLILMVVADIAPFGKNSLTSIDSIHQYVPFFSDFQRKVRGGEGLFYTFNIGMGQNFLSLLLYYIGSPLNVILLLVPRSGILAAFSFLVAIKITISAGAFGYWLSRRRGVPSNNPMITAFSLGYALNAYMLGYYWNVMWLDCIMMMPLAILGMERIFRKESPRLYVLSMFYILYVNYYIAFIICIFMVLWFFAHKTGGVKNFFRSGLVFAGCSLLSAAMAAFALLPAYTGIMQTSSAGMKMPEFGFYGNVFTQLKQHFFLTVPIEMQSFDGGLNVFCGTLAVLLFFLFLFTNRISLAERIRKLLLVGFLFLSFNTTTLNFIWHGFHDQYGIPNRFSFVYIFTLLTIGYEAFMRLRQTGVIRLSLAGSATLIFYFLCFWYGNPDGVLSGPAILGITLAIVVLYMVFLFLRRQHTLRIMTTSVVISSIMIVELMANGIVGFIKNDVANGGYYTEYREAMEKAKENVDRYAQVNGASFWREDQADTRMIDEATYNGFRSVGTFCSTVGGDLVDMMGNLGCYTGVNEFLFYGGNPILNMLIGVRFIYARAEDYAGIASREDPVYAEDGVWVYENPYVLPLGYAVPDHVRDWKCMSDDRISAINDLARTLADTKRPYRLVTPEITATAVGGDAWTTKDRPHIVNFSSEGGDDFAITAEATIEENGIYILDTKGNKIDKVRYSVDGEEMAHGRLETQILDLGRLEAGQTVELEFEFESNPPESGTLSIYLARLDEEVIQQIYDNLADEPLEITYVRDGKVDGEITMKQDGLLFTSIPYDKGWSAEVDGEKAEIIAIDKSFLAVPLSEGHHTVRLRYTAPGFLPGLAVSAVAWLAFVLLFCIKWRKKAKKKESTALHKEEISI